MAGLSARPVAEPPIPGYLRNARMLTIHDEEFQRLKYLICAALGSLTVKIISIHSINTPQQDANFEANHVGSTVVDSWVDSRDLPEENTIHNIIHHGGRFRITDANKGVIFTAGSIGVDPNEVPPGPQHYEFLFCRVATGRSFVVDQDRVGAHGIPSGYDSIAVFKESEEDPTKYFREYILNDESRVYPAFVVNCMFDIEADRIKSVPTCEGCHSVAAVYHCIQDNAKLCERCDSEVHSRNAILLKHTRVPLNEMQTTIGLTMCREHPTIPVQWFDPVAHIPVCIQCKMSGSHSTGEFANHDLVNIGDAFQSSMEDLARERQIVDERRKTIGAQLSSIDRRMSAVNANHEKCQEQIYEIVQRAVQILHEETQSKLSALLSDEFELRRQLEFYSWMESFLNYQKASINPIEFLQAYKNHSGVLAQAPSEIVDGAAGVRPDIRVVGRIEVALDDANVAPSSAAAGVAAGTRATPGSMGSMSGAPPSSHVTRNPQNMRPQPMDADPLPPRGAAPQHGGSMRSNAGPRFGNTASAMAGQQPQAGRGGSFR